MKEILYAACGAWVWVYMLGMIRFKYKPLNCEKCMAGWLCCAMSIGHYPWYEIPFMMCAAMVAAIILTGIMNKV